MSVQQKKETRTYSSVNFQCCLHPPSVLVYIRVNTIFVRQCTPLYPAHNPCKHPGALPAQIRTGQRSPAIVRACVSATFLESGAQKVPSNCSLVRSRKTHETVNMSFLRWLSTTKSTIYFFRALLTWQNCRFLFPPNQPKPLATLVRNFLARTCVPNL